MLSLIIQPFFAQQCAHCIETYLQYHLCGNHFQAENTVDLLVSLYEGDHVDVFPLRQIYYPSTEQVPAKLQQQVKPNQYHSQAIANDLFKTSSISSSL
jgi:hypothetical protein